jgi:hypothetical protein
MPTMARALSGGMAGTVALTFVCVFLLSCVGAYLSSSSPSSLSSSWRQALGRSVGFIYD